MRRHVVDLPAAVQCRPERRGVGQIAGDGFNRQPVQGPPVRAGPDQPPDLRAGLHHGPRHRGPHKPRNPCDQGFHDEQKTGTDAKKLLAVPESPLQACCLHTKR